MDNTDIFKFTIMTEPLDTKGQIREGIKALAGRHKKYGGHETVTRGLVEGLQKIGYTSYNYRPSKSDISDTVHVLSGVNTLRYAIKLKKEGRIKNLSVGPNIVCFSSDYDGIVADENVDLCLTPSDWVSNFYVKMQPSLAGRIQSWPVGVDMDKFKPTVPRNERTTKKVLIYHKDESDQFCWHIDYHLRKRGYKTTILKYGEYTLEQYISLLDQAEFLVALSRQESQGIFMPEAWSMDVPTICFDRRYYRWPGTDIDMAMDISSCPYIAKENGMRFMEMNEFTDLIDNWNEIEKSFSPRKWCRENMSDIVCARNFVKMLENKFYSETYRNEI